MSKLVEIKTKPSTLNVEDFINNITDLQKRQDCFTILKLMENSTNEKPKMWGTSMIGFGNVRYKSPATGREVDWFKIGFSPRKSNLSIHLVENTKFLAELLQKLGKHKTGKGCLYINKLADVDLSVLEEIINVASNRE
jgi:hypothetical protein